METIIVFFRDTLDGTLYIVVSIVCFILILICIWQLIMRSKKKKVAEEEFSSSHVVIINEKGEKETIGIASSTVLPATSVLPNNTTAYDLPAISAVNNVVSTVPQVKHNKQAVMINPLEVASVSSTMNIICATSAQQEALKGDTSVTGSVYGTTNNHPSMAPASVNSQNVEALSQNNNLGLSQNGDSSSGLSTPNNQNFTN